jgi:hypothetical protein
MKKRATTVLLSLLAAFACSAQTAGNYYLLSSGTNVPPLPLNTAPGYPETEVGNAVLVNDTLTDSQVLAHGMSRLQSDSPPPIPSGGTNGVPIKPDTNAWIGTWIHGLPGPQVNGLPASREPALWTIVCTNNSGSELTHLMTGWSTWQKVCPNDTVYVRWPIADAGVAAGWSCFLIKQQGTNDSGGRWTNSFIARMDNAIHDRGNWGGWIIPGWPLQPNAIIYTNCFFTFTNLDSYLCLTNGTVMTNFGKVESLPCATIWDARSGPLTIETGTTNKPPYHPIYTLPSPRPAHIEFPSPPLINLPYADCVWKYNPNVGIDTPRIDTHTYDIVCPDCDLLGTDFGTYPDGTNESHLVHLTQFRAHGIPGVKYIVQYATNPAASWAQEGNTNIQFGDEGIGRITIVRTSTPPTRVFWRMKQVQ